MSDREKYDGKLTDALINAVVRAELRQWVRDVTQNVNIAPSCDPQAVADELAEANRTTRPPDGKAACCKRPANGHEYACIYRERPTDAERAAAWAYGHDYENESS